MIHSKLPDIGTSIFSVMSRLAKDHNAIDLSQGFPDFHCSEILIGLVSKYMKKGFNQYAPMEGVMPLREVIAQKTEELYSYKCDPDKEITITSGATQALFTAISSMVSENDEVIVFEPAYESYVPCIKLNGGRPVFVQLKPPYYQINWDEVQKIINARTRLIILNSPHNPTGSIFSAHDLEKLQKITSGTNIVVISDEVYEHILFDGYEHQSITRFPQIAGRSMVISSFGKTFHTTGWKMGYCIAPEALMKEFRKVHQVVVYAVNTPVQYAIAEFLKNKDNYTGISEFYQKKRDYFMELLKGSRFKLRPAQGSYFQLLDYSKISDEKDTDFAERLVREAGVAAIPVSVFYHEKTDNRVLRFCFAKSDETLEKAAALLQKL